MVVKRLISPRELVLLSPHEAHARIDGEIRAMGPCARLLEWDGLSLIREDWSDNFALHFDVPDDPSFLLI